MRNYYELLNVKMSATPVEVRANFRRLAARYRPTLSIDRIFEDAQFRSYLNAYLTLDSARRTDYDNTLKADHPEERTPPKPLDEIPTAERRVLMAQVAFWRRESAEALHQLRSLLEQEPDNAAGWALLGEVHFSGDRLDKGITAYERAVKAAPDNSVYAARLREAQAVAAGHGTLKVEPTPEEELLHEERRKRWRIAAILASLGVVIIVHAFMTPIVPNPEALYIPWRTVAEQLGGVFFLMLGLAYGRLLQPFEREMVWSTMAAGDRGTLRQYPYGLVLFVSSVASVWLALVALLVTGFMDEEWPESPSIMVFLCVLLNLGLGLSLYLSQQPWGFTLLFGGNLLVTAAMLGWWAGSLNFPSYE